VKTTVTQGIKIGVPKRESGGDSTLFAWVVVPELDKRHDYSGECYNVELQVCVDDPDEERQIADHLANCINRGSAMADALRAAYRAIDSVAFLQREGDTDEIKRTILAAIESEAA